MSAQLNSAPPGERSETTYLNTIAGLVRLLTASQVQDLAGARYDSEAAVIQALLEAFPSKHGLSQRTLQERFAAANRSLDASRSDRCACHRNCGTARCNCGAFLRTASLNESHAAPIRCEPFLPKVSHGRSNHSHSDSPPSGLRDIGPSTQRLYERIARGESPKPVTIGSAAVRWIEAEVVAWVQQQIDASRTQQPAKGARRGRA